MEINWNVSLPRNTEIEQQANDIMVRAYSEVFAFGKDQFRAKLLEYQAVMEAQQNVQILSVNTETVPVDPKLAMFSILIGEMPRSSAVIENLEFIAMTFGINLADVNFSYRLGAINNPGLFMQYTMTNNINGAGIYLGPGIVRREPYVMTERYAAIRLSNLLTYRPITIDQFYQMMDQTPDRFLRFCHAWCSAIHEQVLTIAADDVIPYYIFAWLQYMIDRAKPQPQPTTNE